MGLPEINIDFEDPKNLESMGSCGIYHTHNNKVLLDSLNTNDLRNIKEINNHTHANASALDLITQNDLRNIKEINNHEHSNKVVLDAITQNDLNNLNELNEVVDNVEGSYLSLNGTRNGNLKNVEIKGNTVQKQTNLADIKSVGKKLENQELYEIPILCANGLESTDPEYLEDKITILSPCQIEKVGDIADRIIEKNGVWGVEKNISNIVANGSEGWGRSGVGECYLRKTDVVSNSKIICSKYLNDTTQPEYIKTHPSANEIIVKNTSSGIGLNDFINELSESNMIIKYQTTKPQFIPLPQNQQILLKTFDNKTNISFLTEIEGTIKAQVPKSMKATVNTHTSQIENLHNELGRVKKLEESTVSTVTTESSFVNVQATSNGYFEDVKLSGKTLVSILSFEKVTKNITSKYDYIYSNDLKLTIGETYTVKCSNASPTNIGFHFKYKESNEMIAHFKGDMSYSFVATKNESIALTSLEVGEYNIYNFTITKGDNTNVGYGYIDKGLKSVGDGVDEVVVSSVDGDGNLIKSFYDATASGLPMQNFNIKDDYSFEFNATTWGQGLIVDVGNVIKGETYVILADSAVNSLVNGYDGLMTSGSDLNLSEKNRVEIVATSTGKARLRFKNSVANGNVSFTNVRVVKKGASESFSKYKADKKRILYYDTADNAWKKPTLREWDTIEKHSDGKYYYHQRSLEENYVSGDESKADCITDMTKTVKKLAPEKVYECTNIDLITYANETNYVFSGGVISPRTSLKVQNNISNVVSTLQKKVSVLESYITGMFRAVLAGDMRAVAQVLYPNDFVATETLEGVKNA